MEMEMNSRNAAGEILTKSAVELKWRCSDELLLASFSFLILSCLQL